MIVRLGVTGLAPHSNSLPRGARGQFLLSLSPSSPLMGEDRGEGATRDSKPETEKLETFFKPADTKHPS